MAKDDKDTNANAAEGMSEPTPAPEVVTPAPAPVVAHPAHHKPHGLLAGIAIGVAATLIVLGGARLVLGFAHGLAGRDRWAQRGGPALERRFDDRGPMMGGGRQQGGRFGGPGGGGGSFRGGQGFAPGRGQGGVPGPSLESTAAP